MEVADMPVGAIPVSDEVAEMSEKTKVLIVDDQEVVRLSYLRSLASEHCKVDVAANGDEALQTLKQNRFDLVLLDLRMPGMDGLDVLKTIKQTWPDTEVVIITGYPNVETAKEAVRLGAHGYLAKPVGPADIIDAANDAVIHKKWTLHKECGDRDMGSVLHSDAGRRTGRLAC
jgi:DNA-binding NtrC family response regulator